MLTSALGSNSHIGKFLAGSSAGVTAVTLTYPLDTIRARLAFQVTGEHVYTGILHTALSIFKEVCIFGLNFRYLCIIMIQVTRFCVNLIFSFVTDVKQIGNTCIQMVPSSYWLS